MQDTSTGICTMGIYYYLYILFISVISKSLIPKLLPDLCPGCFLNVIRINIKSNQFITVKRIYNCVKRMIK